jgi:hypothetical protein
LRKGERDRDRGRERREKISIKKQNMMAIKC